MRTLIITFGFLILSVHSLAQTDIKDSLSLVDLYHSLDGDNWVNNENWLTGPVHTWFGITVFRNRVTEIRLGYNELNGQVPRSINDLTALKHLELGYNTGLIGPLPEMDSLQKVDYISLSSTSLNTDFPHQVLKLKNLYSLYLYDCGLTGPIPEDLQKLEKLRALILGNDIIGGTIPAFITQMNSLRYLDLYGCQFEGPLPDFTQMENLTSISIGGNNFGGPFPKWIMEMPQLTHINFSKCGFKGKVPDSLFSYLNPGLRELVLQSNEFYGNVGDFMTAPKKDLYRLGFYGCSFSGVMPEGILNMSAINRLSITGNNIVGLPDFSQLDHPMIWFYVGDNKIPFEFLENCLSVEATRPGRVVLGPQKKLMETDTFYPEIGESIVMESGSGGKYSSYQWYFNDVAILGGNERTYTITSLRGDQYGVYHCVISNDSFEFDLVRNDIHLLQTVNTREFINEDLIEIYPNPTSGILQLRVQEGIIENIFIVNISGQVLESHQPRSSQFTLTLNGYPAGSIILNIQTDSGWVSRMIYLE